MNCHNIKDPNIIGLYLGKIRQDTNRWEPYVTLLKVKGGYLANYTSNRDEVIERYPIHKNLLFTTEKDRVNKDVPIIFDDRMPLMRKDVESNCEFLRLDYPDLDKFAFVSRYGGKVSTDSFDICPILKPDESGRYIFYVSLEGLDDNQRAREIWDDVKTRNGKFSWAQNASQITLKFDRDVLGDLPDYFDLLEGKITKIDIINFSEPSKLQGYGILLKVIMESHNPYAHKLFRSYQVELDRW